MVMFTGTAVVLIAIVSFVCGIIVTLFAEYMVNNYAK